MEKKNSINKIQWIEAKGIALSFLLFSILFICAQSFHPEIFKITKITTGEEWIAHFRHQNMLHVAHLLEFICAPLLIMMAMHFRKMLKDKVPVLAFLGMIAVFIGGLMLIANKSALCLTISGFDRLSDSSLQSMVPGLEILLRKEGMLGILWLLPLLPVGFIMLSIALLKTKMIPLWQSLLMLIGSLLLANPEIEMINFFASFFLAGGLIPYSINLFNKNPWEVTQ